MQAQRFGALTTAVTNLKLSRRAALRRLGGGGLSALVGASGLTGWRGAAAQQATPAVGDAAPALPPMTYRLEASAPQVFRGGNLRTVTSANVPVLDGMGMYSLRIEPGQVRETHWHPNAGELGYCLEGEGTMGVLSSLGDNDTFAISPGSVTFVPKGYLHYIHNTGTDTLHVILTFTNEEPEHLDFSLALPYIPRPILAQTFGVATDAFPNLVQRGDVGITGIEMQTPSAESGAPTIRPFTFHLASAKPQVFDGGTARPATVAEVPRLEDITLFLLDGSPRALREPHWHTNANELNYCRQGTAEILIVAPDGGHQIFTVEPGDVAYIPANWFHYILNTSDEPLQFLVFFSNVTPDHIDLSQTFAYLPPELVAASFGLEPQLFAALPKRGDVFMASRQPG